MSKLSARLVPLVAAALLATAAIAQPYEMSDPTRPVQEEDDPVATRLQLKYPTYDGPVEPNENPYVIRVPLYPEQRSAAYLSSVARSQGATAASGTLSPGAMSGPGAILVSPRASMSATATHQETRRSLKKLIRLLD